MAVQLRSALPLLAMIWAFAPAWAGQAQPSGASEQVASPAAIASEAVENLQSDILDTRDDVNDRVTIPITISGKGPYHFVVDTGSQRTVVSRELVNRLKLNIDRKVTILSMTGLADVDSVSVPRLTYGRTELNGLQAPVLEGEHLGAAGLLGLDGLRNKQLLLDFREGKMDVLPSSHRPMRKPRYANDVIVVEARSKLGQLILLNSTAEGKTVNVILDTGSDYSIGNRALLEKLLKKRPESFRRTVTLTSVTGQTLTGRWGMIHNITIGNVHMKELPIIFAEVSPFEQLDLSDKPAIMLGINALRAFDRVAIDFGRRQVDFLLPDASAPGPGQFANLAGQTFRP